MRSSRVLDDEAGQVLELRLGNIKQALVLDDD